MTALKNWWYIVSRIGFFTFITILWLLIALIDTIKGEEIYFD